ncbi:MAG: DUF2490 domain-containing protein [Dysgonamonadaceae bacterium]|nr:DUF2490 domain-containing protein [Dysgonamonadaceae bacterium]
MNIENDRRHFSLLFFIILLLGGCLQASAQEREMKYGLSLSAGLEKKLNRVFDLNVEEEVRLTNNVAYFNRSVTVAGIDYSLFDRKLKIGGYYAFIYLYNNDYLFEARHRYYFNLSYKETVGQWAFSWRGRWQITQRDENRDEYKINPKQVMKNKLQIEYSVWGKPWKPFISCDLYNDLNNPAGNYLTRIRYQGGATWRLNRTDYLDFFVRYDQYVDRREPAAVSLGVGWKVKW